MTKKEPLTIHFVCLGNVYRSRFAESYAKSKQSQIQFSSSGLRAEDNYFGPISWWGARLAYNEGVAPYLVPSWVQTTQELLERADLVVFMHPKVEALAAKLFDIGDITYRTWHIEDLLPLKTDVPEEEREQESIRQSDEIARQIVKNVDELLHEYDQRTM